MSRVQRAWFAASFAFGLAFIAAIPPFQSNDEVFHWNRLWAVAQGHLVCRTMPEAAKMLPRFFAFSRDAKLSPQHFRNAWAFSGTPDPGFCGDTACSYVPTAYVLPALAARLVALRWDGTPRTGGMLAAVYAARLVNWILFSLAMLWALRAVPWGRNLLLFFYAVPEVLQQATAINNDAFLFALALALLALVTRPARWSRVGLIGLVVTLMTLVRPVYAPLALVSLPLLATLGLPRRWKELALSATLLLPLPAWRLWQSINTYDTSRNWRPSWNVNPSEQLQHLLAHPWKLVTVLWAQVVLTFGRGLMNGGWTSILGAFGWSAFEMHLSGYLLLLLALALAFACDARGPERAPALDGRRWAWVLAVLGVITVVPATVLAMYFLFTTVGADQVNGVQGRYYLVPLLLLLGFGLARAPRPEHASKWVMPATAAAALCTAIAQLLALIAIRGFFYVTVRQ